MSWETVKTVVKPDGPHQPHPVGVSPHGPGWTRRQWLTRHLLGVATLAPWMGHPRINSWRLQSSTRPRRDAQMARVSAQAIQIDPMPWHALAQRAIEAATAAGAQYAEARLTRRVVHTYSCLHTPQLSLDNEFIGIGVRALVGGYWGFSASAVLTFDEAVQLARDAVGQAKAGAKGAPWQVDLGTIPVAIGTWTTPVRIDPFTISIEEKEDFIRYWKDCIADAGLVHVRDGLADALTFLREEHVVATSEGARFTQTVFQSQGSLTVQLPDVSAGLGGLLVGGAVTQKVHGLDWTSAGWELFLDANIPEQLFSGQIRRELEEQAALPHKIALLGKYTLVCDGATMAALTEVGLGVATQVDRALGYEANAGGTSWIADPLGMVGSAQIVSPLVTVTANRSVPGELATVKWDEEGVVPDDFTLIKHGVLVDFQTTREQAAWLAPYYQKKGQPVRSHGCAAVESAHVSPLQHMPNLSLEPSASPIQLNDLVADVPAGILVKRGVLLEIDAQGRTGTLYGDLQEIRNGHLGKVLDGGAFLIDTPSFWHDVHAIGGPATQDTLSRGSIFHTVADLPELIKEYTFKWLMKGQPPQATGHTVRAVAATIPNQALIDPTRRA